MGGALGGVGGIAGKFITCGSKLGNAIQTTAKVSGTISDGMDGFDMLSMGLGMIDPNNPITELNSKLHQSDLYNSFQMGVSMVSSFSGAASQNMACFIAGTMVLTTAGLVAIENIKAGDIVISTNIDTLETAEKPVLETYVRQVDKLVYLTINGEEIVTTDNHPFYVQGRDFIEAGKLLVGDKLISVNGEDLVIEKFFIEETTEPVDVYNFQVEDYHTYFVGNCTVWVHNDKCKVVKTAKGDEEIPIIGNPGSPSWNNAVKSLKEAKGKGNNFIAANASDAERLIKEARPDMPLVTAYDKNLPPKMPNYQIHPVDNEYGMPHIKFEDWSNGKHNGCNGHIFWEELI